ncbi:DUF817 domain-containing protein [Phenylobacterium sp.]|uniref:DUF817 domain-containing protein n=1 Tax=Phenylobacterium sp. TaxID=1871053 RepID=UPI0035C7AA8A
MSLKDRIKGRVEAFDAWARPWAERSPWRGHAYEFLLFGLKQAWACLYAGAMLALLVGTHFLWPDDAPLARYDFLVIAAVALQVFLLATRLERPREAVVIAVFHVVGTAMEVFKTAQGSWTYPEESLLRIGGVPLFSGFMYACVGSFMARIIRLMEIRFENYPPLWAPWILALLSYANFFTHHYLPDIRWGLFALSVLVFGRTWIRFTPDRTARRMPLVLGAVLTAFFIWVAENLGTYASAWVYPEQQDGWTPVSVAKMGSWYLLMMLSFVLVTLVHRPQRAEADAPSGASRQLPLGGGASWRRDARDR